MKTACKFRLYPNRQQEAQLALTLKTCRHLWNKALADRKNAWECEGITRSYEDQAALLVFERQSNPYLKFAKGLEKKATSGSSPLTVIAR